VFRELVYILLRLVGWGIIRAVCPGMQHAAGALNSMCTAGRVGHPDSRHRPHRRPCAGVAGDVAWDQSPPAKDKQIDK